MTEPLAPLAGESPAFTEALLKLRRIAAADAPVLIEGETGTGKELAARAIHYWSARRSHPFVAVNCGALPDHLLEDELFGHERGAFTDAKLARPGLVAVANGGTLFLDEVDSLSARAQVALLRFVQDQRYRPLGCTQERSTDTRLIAATNRPLSDATAAGQFRADLLYRLQILKIELPPLRARGGDAELLALHFIERYRTKYGLPATTLAPETLAWLRSHPWPGNVRELENWIHRELLMADGPQIRLRHDTPSPDDERPPLGKFQRAKSEAVSRFERDYALEVLKRANGNVTLAAQLAGKERRAFGKLLKKHGIDRSTAAS